MGNARDLFKKTGDSKGKFHAKMGSIKERGRLGKGINLEKQYEEVKSKGERERHGKIQAI